MANSDDRKDQPEEISADKQPLGFEQEVAPADPSLTGRRLFLKLALFGAAASMIPEGVMAGIAGSTEPVPLPYRHTLFLQNEKATLSDGGQESTYLVSGAGDLYIDAGGNVFLSNLRATGTFESGDLDVGPMSMVQPAAAMAGRYDGTTIKASTTVLYSDNLSKQQPATLQLNGTLARGNGDVTIGVGFQRAIGTGSGSDIGVVVGFQKVTC
jgi:hypothetical protein